MRFHACYNYCDVTVLTEQSMCSSERDWRVWL